jgi:hypothetical protein
LFSEPPNEVNVLRLISELNISEQNKHALIKYIAKSEQGEDSEDYIYGIALALENEGKITSDDFIAITMREKKREAKPSLWRRAWDFFSLEK